MIVLSKTYYNTFSLYLNLPYVFSETDSPGILEKMGCDKQLFVCHHASVLPMCSAYAEHSDIDVIL